MNVGFTLKQNFQKFGSLDSILKRTFKCGQDMPIFRDCKVPRRDRDFRPWKPIRDRDFEK